MSPVPPPARLHRPATPIYRSPPNPGYSRDMPLPTLSVAFLPKRADPLALAEHEALATALLGACAFTITDRYTTGPDLDTEFQTLELGTATWTRPNPNAPCVRWSTTVERLAGATTWRARDTNSYLSLDGFASHDEAISMYEAFCAALRPRGLRPLLHREGRLERTLRDAGDAEGEARWRAVRVAALLDPEPLADASDSGLAADGLDPETVTRVAERYPDPTRIHVLDLGRNGLTTLPDALVRFENVTLLLLNHNAFSDGPTPDRLRALFPNLCAVALEGCPLRPGVADALRATGLKVRA